jgi:hypothetical protein
MKNIQFIHVVVPCMKLIIKIHKDRIICVNNINTLTSLVLENVRVTPLTRLLGKVVPGVSMLKIQHSTSL